MRVLLVDDERLARSELRRLLGAHRDVEIVGEAASVDEAEGQVLSLAPDLVFLDVEMPGHDGFELLTRLTRAPRVIFVTAFDEYAVRAFEFAAADYLLKPVDPARLAAALARVAQGTEDPPEEGPGGPLPASQQVFVREADRCWLVRLSDVVLFESEGNYTRLLFKGHRPMILRSLSQLETRLDPAVFFRTGRKHIVNLKAIEDITPAVDGGLDLRLTGGLEVSMSRRQAREFRDRMSL